MTLQVADDSITDIQWSQTRPGILFVSSQGGQLGCLDITSQMLHPVLDMQLRGHAAYFQVADCPSALSSNCTLHSRVRWQS